MFEDLSEKLEATFARLRGRGVLSEADIKEGLREVRRVLLEADVNFQLTREFLERVEKKAVGGAQIRTVSPGQQLVKVVYDELTAMLGERHEGPGRHDDRAGLGRAGACDRRHPHEDGRRRTGWRGAVNLWGHEKTHQVY